MSKALQYKQMDPRTLRSLEMFYNGFNSILVNKHYEFITVKDIVAAAKLNRATFYLHFQNKSDFIYFSCHYGFFRALGEQLVLDPLQNPTQRMRGFIHWALEYIQQTFIQWNYQWDEILFEKGTRDAICDYLHEQLSLPITDIHQSVNLGIDIMAISSVITGMGMMWCHGGNVESVDTLTDHISELFANGFSWL
jgi:AcrR family transcriptional regulator